jgi:hypothetical protein
MDPPSSGRPTSPTARSRAPWREGLFHRITELTGLDATKFEDAAQLYLAVKAAEPL